MSYVSKEEVRNENSTHNSMKTESFTTQSLDEFPFIHFVKQDIFNDYIHHIGLWSSEYLNIDPQKHKQDILSMIVRDVLNFEYGKSEVQFLEIKKAHVAGVIDIIHNNKVIQIIKKYLDSKEILSFTPNDALTACLNDYKEEMEISINKDKLYQVLEVNPKKLYQNTKREKNIDTSK